LQLDDTNLAYLCDARQREAAPHAAMIRMKLPLRYARLINAAIAGRPAGMTVCIHLCRGNFRVPGRPRAATSRWRGCCSMNLNVDGYFPRVAARCALGDFAPLRHVPRGKKVVLGLVTTKPELRLESVR